MNLVIRLKWTADHTLLESTKLERPEPNFLLPLDS
jgi:hypothetical protein